MSNEKAFWDSVDNLPCWNSSKDLTPGFANYAEVLYAALFSLVEHSNIEKGSSVHKEVKDELKFFAEKNLDPRIDEKRQSELQSKVIIAKWDAKEIIRETGVDSFISDFVAICLQDKRIEPWEYRLIHRLFSQLLPGTRFSRLRYRVVLFLSWSWVSTLITSLIILNAVQLGLMTCSWFEPYKGKWFYRLDFSLMCIFSVEIFCRIFAFRKDYFRKPQNVFDFVVVAVSWIPSPIFHWASSLRIFRVMLLLNRLGHLKSIMRSLIVALPNIGGISVLLLIVFYVFAVLTTNLFRNDFAAFQSLEVSFLSLFQLMTLESWPELLYPIFTKYPYSWMIFIPFIVLTSYIFLNLVIGIIVNSMHDISLKKKSMEKREIDEIRDIRKQINLLSQKLETIQKYLSGKENNNKKD